MDVSVLGFGGSEIGLEHASREEAEALLGGAIDSGLNVIDTASAYLESEALIGSVISHRRSEFFLFTKCGATDGFARSDWTTDGILRQIELSLARLRTDHVDLVQLHSCSAEILGKGDAIEGLRRAREKGRTRFIGYSGDGTDALAAIECGAFDTLQTSVSVADQEAISLTIPGAMERGMGVIAKRPLANTAWRWAGPPSDSYHRPYWERMRKLRYELQSRPLADAVGIALRFTLGVEGVDTAIVGTKSAGRWQENAKLLDAGPLPRVEFDAIRARWNEIADASWTGQR